MNIEFVKSTNRDSDLLAEIRVAAMRPSLEAVGRYDPARARNRFLDTFEPNATFKIVVEDKVVGFIVLKDREDIILLDHLYLSSEAQGQGLGGKVLAFAKSLAKERALPLQLCALNGSKANDFYLNNGFEVTRKDELDTYYVYNPNG